MNKPLFILCALAALGCVCLLMGAGVNSVYRHTDMVTLVPATGITLHTNVGATVTTITVSNSLQGSGLTNYWRPLWQSAPLSAAGTSETMMYSNFIAANSVGVNSSILRANYAFDKEGANGATARVKLYWGSTTASTLFFDTEVPNVAASPDFGILVEMMRTADATETAVVRMACDDVGAYTNLYHIDASMGYSWTSDLVIFATGIITTGDDLTGRLCTGDVRPAFE